MNTAEGFLSVFKRGMIGTYQHVESQHLHRYVHEFDLRQSTREKLGVNDTMRTEIALQGFIGKRLTYRTPNLRKRGNVIYLRDPKEQHLS